MGQSAFLTFFFISLLWVQVLFYFFEEGIMKKVIIFTALFFVLFSINAATLTVCETGCDYTSVKTAVGAAAADDTIQISAGIYLDWNITI
jgi:hypothetical protein